MNQPNETIPPVHMTRRRLLGAAGLRAAPQESLIIDSYIVIIDGTIAINRFVK